MSGSTGFTDSTGFVDGFVDSTGFVDTARWLIDHRAGLDRGEAQWLERLAQFDREGRWAEDGQLSCAGWLAWRTHMARSTAFEKLRVAHELHRRPIVAAAFRDGFISYSAARAITRLDRPDPEVDQALVDVAKSDRTSIHDLEKLVRTYLLYADQDRPPADDRRHARDVRLRRGGDGTARITCDLTDLEADEVAAALQIFVDLAYRPSPVDRSSRGDSPIPPDEAPMEGVDRANRRADALMDLVATAARAADQGHAAGDDRYVVHLVAQEGASIVTTVDGSPLHPADAAAIRCDTSTVTHTTTAGGEPLDLGRKTRQWSTAQRRAITVRDGGHCRFPGCTNRHVDIHHLQSWEHDGRTDTANGLSECRRHHRLLHRGYRASPTPTGEVHFYRPDGTYLGSTCPAVQTASLATLVPV
ncbi:MAG: DUF222 domain-containing protein [Actinomycetota bacterium]|nr:DUF222 domain-containing protein [Actinomycetota bacterium]